jgi:hypothetical protein
MYLYYDRVSKIYSLDTGEDAVFLGPITHALLVLQREYNLTQSQANEAVLRAFGNGGAPVDIDNVKRMACTLISKKS